MSHPSADPQELSAIERAHRPGRPEPSHEPPRPDDVADGADADVRWALVERMRQQIASGALDDEAKLDAILDRLAADLGVSLEA